MHPTDNTTDTLPDVEPFSPVGHVIVCFPEASGMQGALAALHSLGFAPQDVIAYTPEQMRRQAEANMAQAGVLASLGQDLNLMKADLASAEQGHSFLAVHAPDDQRAAQVADVARRFGALRAQKYGHLIIEELLTAPGGEPQVFESNDRGLDEVSTQPASTEASAVPTLPHEHDEQAGMTGGVQSPRVQQGAKDLARGLKDTSRAPEADAAYQRIKP